MLFEPVQSRRSSVHCTSLTHATVCVAGVPYLQSGGQACRNMTCQQEQGQVGASQTLETVLCVVEGLPMYKTGCTAAAGASLDAQSVQHSGCEVQMH